MHCNTNWVLITLFSRWYRNQNDNFVCQCPNTDHRPDWQSVPGWTYRQTAVTLPFPTHLHPFQWVTWDFSHLQNSCPIPSSTMRQLPALPLSLKPWLPHLRYLCQDRCGFNPDFQRALWRLFHLPNSMECRHLHLCLVDMIRRPTTDMSGSRIRWWREHHSTYDRWPRTIIGWKELNMETSSRIRHHQRHYHLPFLSNQG